MGMTFADWFSNPEVIIWKKDWDSILYYLKGLYGNGTKVAVIPNATI
jgi:hypothetical protein